MNRREFIKGAAVVAAGSAVANCAADEVKPISPVIGFNGGDGVNITGIGLAKPLKVTVITDTHFGMYDERDAEYADFYQRLLQPPEKWPARKQAFEKMLTDAKAEGRDAVLLIGDIMSCPTLANIEYIREKLSASGLDYLYISGNHDWHFEGVPGSDLEQRALWIERLKSLYRGENPFMYAKKIGGVRFVMIDNSVYHVLPEQLAFWKREAAKGDPMVLAMHIPFWAPGYPYTTCAAPGWGAKVDPYWKIERRQIWAEQLMPSTYEFRDAVFSTSNLIAVFAGHEHRLMFSNDRGKTQIVVPLNHLKVSIA